MPYSRIYGRIGKGRKDVQRRGPIRQPCAHELPRLSLVSALYNRLRDQFESILLWEMARNVTMDEWGFLQNSRYLIHDRDTKYTKSFQTILEAAQVKPAKLPARSPNLNAYAERWVRSVKEECLSKLILFGVGSLRRALDNYMPHYHEERNHQGKSNVLLFPQKTKPGPDTAIDCHERLGGLLRYYHRKSA